MIITDEAATLFNCSKSSLKDFEAEDLYNKNIVKGFMCMTSNDLYGSLLITEVNGKHIRNLRDVKDAMATPVNGFHVIKFAGIDDDLVLDAAAAARANDEILSRYSVPAPENFKKK